MVELEAIHKRVIGGLGALVLAGVLGGCAAFSDRATPEECMKATCLAREGDAPEWIINPQLFSGDQGAIYGVANASMIQNTGLLRRAAESQARRAIATFWETEIEAMLIQYANSVVVGSDERGREEQDVEDIVRELTDATLTGTAIMEYWENPYQQEAYALARLDFDANETFEAMIEGLKRQRVLAEREIEAIRKRKKEFLEDMEEKLKERQSSM